MKNIILIGLVLALVIVASCKKDDVTPAPSKADVFGYVSLYDDGINKLDNSGMKVYVDGAEDIFSATTDSEGNFTIKDVTLGTYGIVYEKEGYGTYKIYNVKLEKAGESVSIEKIPSLGKLSTTKVTSLSSRIEGEDVMLTYDTDPAGNSNAPRYIRYFFDDEAGVTSSTYKHHTVVYEIKDSPHERWFSTENLKDLGFKSGETVYVKVCGDSFWSNDYDEPSFGIRLFPNLNMTSADEVSFVIP